MKKQIPSIGSNSTKRGAKVAVIGGGVFGCTVAYKLAQAGHSVTLFESRPTILTRASGYNHHRVHRGYHYPRCRDTMLECVESFAGFKREFGPALIGAPSYYSIADRSHGSISEYKASLGSIGLWYEDDDSQLVSGVCGTVKVDEDIISPSSMFIMLTRKLLTSGVQVRTGVEYRGSNDFDFEVPCVYDQVNSWSNERVPITRRVVEKPVFRTGRRNVSITILDGNFCCITPLGGNHVLGCTDLSNHWESADSTEIPSELSSIIHRGVMRGGFPSRLREISERAREFFPDFRDWKYLGSFFTIRTIVDSKDDSRQSLIVRNGNRISVLGMKIVTCVDTASKVVEIVGTNR